MAKTDGTHQIHILILKKTKLVLCIDLIYNFHIGFIYGGFYTY